MAGSGGIGVSIGDRTSTLQSVRRPADIRGERGCRRDREGVVQPQVQDSHPRRQCHLARGRGATREPITGTLSSPCAQSAPGQGKPLVLIGDIEKQKLAREQSALQRVQDRSRKLLH